MLKVGWQVQNRLRRSSGLRSSWITFSRVPCRGCQPLWCPPSTLCSLGIVGRNLLWTRVLNNSASSSLPRCPASHSQNICHRPPKWTASLCVCVCTCPGHKCPNFGTSVPSVRRKKFSRCRTYEFSPPKTFDPGSFEYWCWRRQTSE